MTSTQTLNAALRGLTEADSDGIVQVSVGGAEYFSGASVANAEAGAVALAEAAHLLDRRAGISGQRVVGHERSLRPRA